MKRLKYKEFKYDCPLYPVSYRYIFTNDLKKYMNQVHSYDATGSGACTISNQSKNTVDVVLPYKCPPEFLYHEAAHLAMCILGHTGVKYGYKNQEPLAYVLGHVLKMGARAFHARGKAKWKHF